MDSLGWWGCPLTNANGTAPAQICTTGEMLQLLTAILALVIGIVALRVVVRGRDS